MSRGRKDKWGSDQVAAVRAKALEGASARTIAALLEAGELPGYIGDPMPLGTIKYHAAQARAKALEGARVSFEPGAVDAQIGAILAGMLKDAELGRTKARRQLRAGDPAGWDTLERAAKALAQVKRVSDLLSPPAKPGKQTPNAAQRSTDEGNVTDLVSRLASQRTSETERQPG